MDNEDVKKMVEWVTEYPWRIADLLSMIAEELGQRSKVKIGEKREMNFESIPSKDGIVYRGNFRFEKNEKYT